MKSGVIIAIVLVVVGVLVGAYFLAGYKVSSTSNNPKDTIVKNPNTPNTTASANGGVTHSVSISNFAFNPATLPVRVGDTVVWTNNDPAPHTITSDSGSELASDSFSNGQTYSHTFTTAGPFDLSLIHI